MNQNTEESNYQCDINLHQKEVNKIPYYMGRNKSTSQTVRVPEDNKISCKGWPQEAIMRMLINNMEWETPEDTDEFTPGKPNTSRKIFEKAIEALKRLECEETLLIQSGKPIGIFKTHRMAPRVLISNAMLVPMWATEKNFKKLKTKGLTMYNPMANGSWTKTCSQDMLFETLEVFDALARKHFNGTLRGKLVLSAGLGAVGGALSLAVTMCGGAALVIDVDKDRIQKAVRAKYCDTLSDNPIEAFEKVVEARDNGRAVSLGLVGNAAQIYPALLDYGILPDVVTDLTSSHDLLDGYIPAGMELEQAITLKRTNPKKYIANAKKSIVAQVNTMLEMQRKGAIAFEYGNSLRRQAYDAGVENAFDIPGYVPLFIRDLICEGRGSFRWAAVSGKIEDIYKTEEKLLELFPENKNLKRWINVTRKQVNGQELPIRKCWLGYDEKPRFGLAINDMVKEGLLSAPIVIGRDYYNTGSAASPYGETEAMKDGSDSIADWPILNALLNAASGAEWVSVSHGSGVGIGYSIHTCMAVVADGTDEAKRKIEMVLKNDPGIGIIRHADAGYERAIQTVKYNNIKIIL
jgi:urocanate hydratase